SSLSLSPSAVARASTSTLFPYTTLFRSVGDAVFGMLDGWHGASCAEYVAVKAHQIAHKPDTIDFDDAASVALVGLTALQALRDRSEEHTSELQSRENLVCRLLLEKKKHQ